MVDTITPDWGILGEAVEHLERLCYFYFTE